MKKTTKIVSFKKVSYLLACTLFTCSASGIFLFFFYDYSSTFKNIKFQPNSYLYFLKNIHKFSTNLIFATIYIHLIYSVYSSRFLTNIQSWISGIFMLLIATTSAIIGEILPRTQKSFWSLKILSNILENILGHRFEQIDGILNSRNGTILLFLSHSSLSLLLIIIFFAVHTKKKIIKIKFSQAITVIATISLLTFVFPQSKLEYFDEFSSTKISVSWYIAPLFNFLYSISNPKFSALLSLGYLLSLMVSPYILKKFECKRKKYSKIRAFLILFLQLASILFSKYKIMPLTILMLFANYAILLVPFRLKKNKSDSTKSLPKIKS